MAKFENILIKTTQLLDAFSQWTGKIISWLTLLMVAAMLLRLLLSHLLPADSFLGQQIIKVQESITWMHAAVFLLGAAFTLNANEHVRVDIFYRQWSQRRKAWVDMFGTVFFLWPVCALLIWSSWSFVSLSWKFSEVSPEPNGLPALYLLKSMLIVMAIFLAIEGINQFLKNLLRITKDNESHSSHAVSAGSTD